MIENLDGEPNFRFLPGYSPFMTQERYAVMLHALRLLQSGWQGKRVAISKDGNLLLKSVDINNLSQEQLGAILSLDDDVEIIRSTVSGISMQMSWMFSEIGSIRRFNLTNLIGSRRIFWSRAAASFVSYAEYLKPEWASCSSWNLYQEIYARYALNAKGYFPTRRNLDWVKNLEDSFSEELADIELDDNMLGWMGVLPRETTVDSRQFSAFSFVEKDYGILYMARDPLLGRVCDEVADQLYAMHRLVLA